MNQNSDNLIFDATEKSILDRFFLTKAQRDALTAYIEENAKVYEEMETWSEVECDEPLVAEDDSKELD